MEITESLEIVPPHPRQEDVFDWHGCSAVQFDPEKLGGRATVGATRMDADGVLLNYEDGMTAEEISEAFGSDLNAVRQIIAFAEAKQMKAIA
jgi:uncharacterized protein (DUF433 family)